MTHFSPEQQLEIIKQAEEKGACEGNLNAAKKYYADGDFEGVERVSRGNRDWLKYKLNLDILLDGVREKWYNNGQMRSRETYKDGELHGDLEKWHENGQMMVRATYKDGDLEGIAEEWHKNGQMSFRATYIDGVLDGVLEEWQANGQMRSRETYKDGKLISEEFFK